MKPKSPKNKTLDWQLKDIPKAQLNRILSKDDTLEKLETIVNHSICGNTFELMEWLPKQCVDLAIVDPPYNLDKKYDGKSFKKMKSADYQAYTVAWIERLKPLLKEKATVYVCTDWQTSLEIAPLLGQYFHIQNRITWQREKGRGTLSNWKNGMEDIWFLTNTKDYTFNLEQVRIRHKVFAPYKENGQPKDWQETEAGKFRDTLPSNFWPDISVPYWSMPENTAHPTQKPEKLLAKLILASSNRGDLVFDPFSGSGSSLVTAKKLGRRYVGIEQSLRYTAWGEVRLKRAERDSTIQGYAAGVFWERNTWLDQKKSRKNQKGGKSG